MQLVAYSEDGALIFADQAIKGVNYHCIECKGVVHRRGGFHRRDHFYHLAGTSHCQQSAKSMRHLQVQCAIQQALPLGEAIMEKKIPEIQRIADVFWERESIVFEVQCSYMSKEELLGRNQDYSSQGYEVVWIFHDQKYNRLRLSAVEAAQMGSTFYYTNIDSNGDGMIYDQLFNIDKGLRVKRSARLEVDLSEPKRNGGEGKFDKRKLYFAGDCYDRFLKGEIGENEYQFYVEEVKQVMMRKGAFYYLSCLLDLISSYY
ncbi:MAG: competence protein CoiA family protein, partial [Chlamydiota bacterium]